MLGELSTTSSSLKEHWQKWRLEANKREQGKHGALEHATSAPVVGLSPIQIEKSVLGREGRGQSRIVYAGLRGSQSDESPFPKITRRSWISQKTRLQVLKAAMLTLRRFIRGGEVTLGDGN